MVNFSGLEFIFRFLPVFLIIYWIIPSRYRDALLFAGSLVFYAFGAKLFVILLFLLVLVNYVLGEMVWVMPGRRRKVQQRQMLVTIVTVDVIVLIVFKILALKVKASLLPLGLSFYIFSPTGWAFCGMRSSRSASRAFPHRWPGWGRWDIPSSSILISGDIP